MEFNITRKLGALFFASVVGFSSNAAADLKVVELFTSQGCYSCPAADKLISELAAADSSILNLEFHVDYWDKLRYGSHGVWQDPFSSSEYTLRQRAYSARKLRGENGVYTPQAVINGQWGQVGSNRRAVQKSLAKIAPAPVRVSISRKDDANLSVNVSGVSDGEEAEVYLVSFLEETQTEVTSGENHDKVMKNHNVVTSMTPIAKLSELGIDAIQVAYSGGENQGCAVLVQTPGPGAILGAARCPK